MQHLLDKITVASYVVLNINRSWRQEIILVNLPQTWPAVEAGTRTAADVTLGEWAQVPDEALSEFGDVVLGVYKHVVVSAFDIDGWTRDPATGRVTFTGTESERWAHLVGGANPGPNWTQGQARPVKYLDTDEVEGPVS